MAETVGPRASARALSRGLMPAIMVGTIAGLDNIATGLAIASLLFAGSLAPGVGLGVTVVFLGGGILALTVSLLSRQPTTHCDGAGDHDRHSRGRPGGACGYVERAGRSQGDHRADGARRRQHHHRSFVLADRAPALRRIGPLPAVSGGRRLPRRFRLASCRRCDDHGDRRIRHLAIFRGRTACRCFLRASSRR